MRGDTPHPKPTLRSGFDLSPLGRGKSGFILDLSLALGLAAARGFGVIDRAEPARALSDVHLDLCVPAAGRLVINAFA